MIGLVPARSGSSVADKNLREVLGQSLLQRAIEGALESSGVDEVWVSSDSEDYLEKARAYGAKCHLRERSAASSSAPADSVLEDFFRHRSAADVVYLQPTSPLRSASSIDTALELFSANPPYGVMSVTALNQFPEKVVTIDPQSGTITLQSHVFENRNEAQSRFYPNGAIYILRAKGQARPSFRNQVFLPVLMSRIESIDVDTEEDLELAERVALGSLY